MNEIHYPRSLNRPTYILWRWAWPDMQLGAALLFGSVLPSLIFTKLPIAPQVILVLLFMVYRGMISSFRPRGYDTHRMKALLVAKTLSPGHYMRKCFVVPEIKAKEPGKLAKFTKLLKRSLNGA